MDFWPLKTPILKRDWGFLLWIIFILMGLLPEICQANRDFLTGSAVLESKFETGIRLRDDVDGEDFALQLFQSINLHLARLNGESRWLKPLQIQINYGFDILEAEEERHVEDFHDLDIGIKMLIFKETALTPTVTLFSDILFPTGNKDRGTGVGEKLFTFSILFQKSIKSVDTQFNIGWTIPSKEKEDLERSLFLTLASSHPITRWLSFDMEMTSFNLGDTIPQNTDSTFFGGFSFSVKDGLILDLGVRTGLTSSAHDWNFSMGFSYEF